VRKNPFHSPDQTLAEINKVGEGKKRRGERGKVTSPNGRFVPLVMGIKKVLAMYVKVKDEPGKGPSRKKKEGCY